MKLKLTTLLAFIVLILAACSSGQSGNMGNMDQENLDQKTAEENAKGNKVEGLQTTSIKTLTGTEFALVAKEAKHQLTDEITVNAWTFNGTVPGSQIRVKEGDKVTINLKMNYPILYPFTGMAFHCKMKWMEFLV